MAAIHEWISSAVTADESNKARKKTSTSVNTIFNYTYQTTFVDVWAITRIPGLRDQSKRSDRPWRQVYTRHVAADAAAREKWVVLPVARSCWNCPRSCRLNALNHSPPGYGSTSPASSSSSSFRQVRCRPQKAVRPAAPRQTLAFETFAVFIILLNFVSPCPVTPRNANRFSKLFHHHALQ